MANFYISGSRENINGGVISNIGKDSSSSKNLQSSNTVVNGGSIVINGVNTDPANNSAIFAFNNNKPIVMPYSNIPGEINNKKISGNNSNSNRSTNIISSLTSTAIRDGKFNFGSGIFTSGYPQEDSYLLCPDTYTKTHNLGKAISRNKLSNKIVSCNQFKENSPDYPEIQLNIDESGNLIQNGTVLRFRSLDNNEYFWNRMFINQSDISSISSTDRQGNNISLIPYIEISDFLSNGNYEIEYDILNTDFMSMSINSSQLNFNRINSNIEINNSTISNMYEIELPEFPNIMQDPYTYNYNSCENLRKEAQTEYYSNFYNLLSRTFGGSYIVGVRQFIGDSSIENGEININSFIQYNTINNSCEVIPYTENISIGINVSMRNGQLDYFSMILAGSNYVNNIQTILAVSAINLTNS